MGVVVVEHQGHPAFGDAHRRHWQDAELLLRHERWANADQLYGLSAECGLKAVMRSLRMMDVDSHGVPTRREHRQHVKNFGLRRFREQAWDLFREHLYDDVEPSDGPQEGFSFDLHEEGAPHDPIVIHWTRGLAAGASLRDLDRKTTVRQAYLPFLSRFDELRAGDRNEGVP